MTISLIGQSGSGKSHVSELLKTKFNFQRFSVDELIEQKLSQDLLNTTFNGIGSVSEWLGYPTSATYSERARQYLSYESGIVKDLVAQHDNAACVIDTTGSIIYLEPAITAGLKAKTKVIYLEQSPKHLLEVFCAAPKPIIWGDIFKKVAGETDNEAAIRSFSDLIEFRHSRYVALADIKIKVAGLTIEEIADGIIEVKTV